MCLCVHTPGCVCARVCAHTPVRVCVHTCVCVHTPCVSVCTRVCVCTRLACLCVRVWRGAAQCSAVEEWTGETEEDEVTGVTV